MVLNKVVLKIIPKNKHARIARKFLEKKNCQIWQNQYNIVKFKNKIKLKKKKKNCQGGKQPYQIPKHILIQAFYQRTGFERPTF